MGIVLWIGVSVTGLVLGAFTSRFLAENYYHTLAGLNAWPQTAILTLGVTLALLAFWRLYSTLWARQAKIPLDKAVASDALTYIPLFLLLLYLTKRTVNPLQGKVLLCGCLLLVIALKVKTLLRVRRWKWVIGSSLFILTFIVYLSTLSPTVGEADSFEFQVVSYTLGIAHPSGYPLYILLGKLFTFLPIGNVAYRINLISPLFASLAVVFAYLCLVRLTNRRLISTLAALTFAFSRTFWSQAVIAEVYTLNAFFVALVLYLLLEVGKFASSQTHKLASWQVGKLRCRLPAHFPTCLLAFVYGLSLTNHLTMALLAPAMAIYTWLTAGFNFVQPGSPDPGQKRGFGNPLKARVFGLWILNFGLLLILFLLGLSVYLYLPLRWPALHGRSMALGEFVNWVLGSRFRGALHWDAWLKDPERYAILGRLILEQYGWAGLILGLAGVIWLFAKRRREAIFLLIAYLVYFIYGLCYYVPDISAFIIPAHLIFAVWIGVGFHGLLQVASGKWQAASGKTQSTSRKRQAKLPLPCPPAPLLPCSSALLPLSCPSACSGPTFPRWT